MIFLKLFFKPIMVLFLWPVVMPIIKILKNEKILAFNFCFDGCCAFFNAGLF
jgi:hypothetical protein